MDNGESTLQAGNAELQRRRALKEKELKAKRHAMRRARQERWKERLKQQLKARRSLEFKKRTSIRLQNLRQARSLSVFTCS